MHYDLGLALKLKDKLPEAIVELKKAAELDPSQPDVHYTLGVTFWQQGEFDQAANELRAAIQSKPDYAEAHYTLGTVLKQQGKLPEAAASLREAIRLQPDFAGAHTTLSTILRQLGDEEGAARERQLGAQISKDKTNLQAATFDTNSGKRLLGLGDLDGAIPSSVPPSPWSRLTRLHIFIWRRRCKGKVRPKKPARNISAPPNSIRN